MGSKRILAIDAGTTGIRTILFDKDSRVSDVAAVGVTTQRGTSLIWDRTVTDSAEF